MMTYREAVTYIEETPKFTKKNTLENTRAILRCLGNPQDKMKILHVAGTNGKGSVCSFLYFESGRKAYGTFYLPSSGGDQRAFCGGRGAGKQ